MAKAKLKEASCYKTDTHHRNNNDDGGGER